MFSALPLKMETFQMKKLICTLLTLAMLLGLAGCTTAPTGSGDASAGVTEPAGQDSTEEPTGGTGLPGNRNPLTGEETDTDISQNCPVAVMLNNIKQALPQSGNSKADFFFEIPEEGGITRIMALYQDISDVGTIGTVRSTRPYYVRLAVGHDAILTHCGGSSTAYYIIKKYMRNADFNDMDCLNKGTNCAYSYFYRSQARLNAGYATEHTMYTDSDKIQDYLKNGKDDVRTKHKKNFDAGLRFAEDGTPDGASATDVDVEMSQYKDTTFQYNADKKTYAVGQFGTGYIDEANGNKQVEVTNVLVILTDISVVKESIKGHLSVSTTGTGTGYYISGGKYIPITWKKDSVTAPQRFYDQDGNELKLSVGKTFECMIDKSRDVKIDGKVLEKPADANENDNEVDKMALAD